MNHGAPGRDDGVPGPVGVEDPQRAEVVEAARQHVGEGAVGRRQPRGAGPEAAVPTRGLGVLGRDPGCVVGDELDARGRSARPGRWWSSCRGARSSTLHRSTSPSPRLAVRRPPPDRVVLARRGSCAPRGRWSVASPRRGGRGWLALLDLEEVAEVGVDRELELHARGARPRVLRSVRSSRIPSPTKRSRTTSTSGGASSTRCRPARGQQHEACAERVVLVHAQRVEAAARRASSRQVAQHPGVAHEEPARRAGRRGRRGRR